jgi:hypothetical protein
MTGRSNVGAGFGDRTFRKSKSLDAIVRSVCKGTAAIGSPWRWETWIPRADGRNLGLHSLDAPRRHGHLSNLSHLKGI